MKTYGAAVIGLGIMGKRMLGQMTPHDRFSISGIWDASETAKGLAAKEFPGAPPSDSAGMLISSEDTDLVYIACPPAFHRDYALMAIDAGKAIFCEKPLGVDLAESEDLVKRIEAAGLANAVNFSQACSPALNLMKDRLDDGTLGSVIGAQVVIHFTSWPRAWQMDADWLRFRDQGGFTREVLSHYIFDIERLFGRAELKTANPVYQSDERLCETHMRATLDCGDVPVSIIASAGGAAPEQVEFTIYGSKQSLQMRDWVKVFQSTGSGWEDALPQMDDPRKTGGALQLDNVAAMLDGQSHLMPDANDALSVQRIIEAMLEGK